MDYTPVIHNHADISFFKGQNRIESIILQRPKNDSENYLSSTIVFSPIKSFLTEISKEQLSSNVLTNAIHLIEKLPESFLLKLNSDAFYKSKYNTLIIDFEDENSSLTVDIGAKSFGYFIEKNNEIADFKESLLTENKEERLSNYGVLNSAIIKHIL